MSNVIVKSFVPDKTPQQIESEKSETQFISWQRLQAFLNVNIKDETKEVAGIIVNDTGIVIVLSEKLKPLMAERHPNAPI